MLLSGKELHSCYSSRSQMSSTRFCTLSIPRVPYSSACLHSLPFACTLADAFAARFFQRANSEICTPRFFPKISIKDYLVQVCCSISYIALVRDGKLYPFRSHSFTRHERLGITRTGCTPMKKQKTCTRFEWQIRHSHAYGIISPL